VLGALVIGTACGPAAVAPAHGELVPISRGRDADALSRAYARARTVLIVVADGVYAPPAACLPDRAHGGAGEQRDLGGAGEQRDLGGAGEQRDLGGAGEARDLGGAGEQRDLGGAGEQRDLGGAGELRDRGGAGEARSRGGGGSALSCVRGDRGFTVQSRVPVEYFDGASLRPAPGGFVPD
jgi:hypothetical protein